MTDQDIADLETLERAGRLTPALTQDLRDFRTLQRAGRLGQHGAGRSWTPETRTERLVRGASNVAVDVAAPSVGAEIGGAIGSLGGPLAPVTVPLGIASGAAGMSALADYARGRPVSPRQLAISGGAAFVPGLRPAAG